MGDGTELNMKNLSRHLSSFLKDESGQSTTEYILILSVVVMIVMQFKKQFQGKLNGIIEKVGGDIDSAAAGSN